MIKTESLIDALAASSVRMVTFVGAGGKTSAIVRAAAEMSSIGRSVIATTTTLVGERLAACGEPVLASDGDDAVHAALASSGTVFLHSGRRCDGKYGGVAAELLTGLVETGAADCILVEGDGARGLPIKMPDAHEPVIPRATGLVVPVVGMDALDRPIAEGAVHRPDLFASLNAGGAVTQEVVVSLLGSESGGMKSIPAAASVRPLLNKTGLPGGDRADLIARELLTSAPAALDRVICGDVQAGGFRVFLRGGTRSAERRPSGPFRS